MWMYKIRFLTPGHCKIVNSGTSCSFNRNRFPLLQACTVTQDTDGPAHPFDSHWRSAFFSHDIWPLSDLGTTEEETVTLFMEWTSTRWQGDRRSLGICFDGVHFAIIASIFLTSMKFVCDCTRHKISILWITETLTKAFFSDECIHEYSYVSGSLVHAAWRIIRLRMEKTAPRYEG
jgi:hypothetical protein